MDYRNEMIAAVSELYREKLKNKECLASEIRETKARLKDHTIPHNEYTRLDRHLKMLEDDYTILVYVTQGISLAREVLFDSAY